MKSKFKFDEVSPDWHYNKFNRPSDELEHIDSIEIGEGTLKKVNTIIASPYDEGGIKRIHIGDPAEDINSSTINNRIAHMREVGYSTNHYFIEFINDKFPELENMLSDMYNISYYHCCAIIIEPGQCMPVHDDTYSYLKKYMKRDYPNVKYDMVKNVRRYLTFLTNWEWGQCLGAGNVIKWQWKKGDVYKWDHKMLHWSSNSSMKPMVFFEITGLDLNPREELQWPDNVDPWLQTR